MTSVDKIQNWYVHIHARVFIFVSAPSRAVLTYYDGQTTVDIRFVPQAVPLDTAADDALAEPETHAGAMLMLLLLLRLLMLMLTLTLMLQLLLMQTTDC